MASADFEAIQQMDPEETLFSHPVDTEPYNALGIGPGLGTNETTAIALIAQIRRSTCPLVIDADAINILSSHRAWMPVAQGHHPHSPS